MPGRRHAVAAASTPGSDRELVERALDALAQALAVRFLVQLPLTRNVSTPRRIETRLDARQLIDAAQQQPGAREQRHRQRHLHADEQPLQRVARGHLRARRSRQGEPAARVLRTAGNRPQRSATTDGRRRRVREDPRIDPDLVEAREIRRERPKRGGRRRPPRADRRRRRRTRAARSRSGAGPPPRRATRRARSGRAISCSRRAARDSSRAAMLVHAISSSTDTAPNSSHSDPRTPPITVSLSGSEADADLRVRVRVLLRRAEPGRRPGPPAPAPASRPA